MAIVITHSTVATLPDEAGKEVNKNEWNADHTLTGIASAAQGGTGIAFFTAAGPTVARVYTFPDAAATILYSGGALGTPSSGTLTNATGLPEAGLSISDNTTANFSITAHGFVPKGTNVGSFLKDDGTWAAPTASTTLNGVSAATGAVTIASGNNTGIVWNWANTTDSTISFTFGETSAATNGTVTSGVPNQALLKLRTAAGSTQSPLVVYSRDAHVFSVNPAAAQIVVTSGSVSIPFLQSAADAGGGGTGFYRSGTGAWSFASASTKAVTMDGYGLSVGGTAGSPGILDIAGNFNGFFFGVSTAVGISIAGLENSRWLGGTGTQQWQVSNAGAVTAAYAINFRKSRGTVASPTVITTGDDLATITGAAYVGATGLYVNAAQILFDSIGTVANTTSGIGGKIDFNTAIVGTVGLTTKMSIWDDGDVTIGIASPATTATVGFPQIPTMAGTPTGVPTVKTGFNPMVYDTTGRKLWIYDYGGTPAWVGVVLA